MSKQSDKVTVSVTRLKKVGWGIKIYVSGKEWSNRFVKSRKDIHPSIADDLRMIDKCGVDSPMASASRDRQIRKIR